MAQRETILKIEMITDDSAGVYCIGEIDTLPDTVIESHIARFGEYGFEQWRDFLVRGLMVANQKIIKQRTEENEQTCQSVQ